jgi:hypothetical protein
MSLFWDWSGAGFCGAGACDACDGGVGVWLEEDCPSISGTLAQETIAPKTSAPASQLAALHRFLLPVAFSEITSTIRSFWRAFFGMVKFAIPQASFCSDARTCPFGASNSRD